MTPTGPMQVPDELTLLELLEVAPSESRPSEGFWRYELHDNKGIVVELSFDVLERSLQTVIRVGTHVVATISSEGGVSLHPIQLSDKTALRGEFKTQGIRTVLDLKLKPSLEVRWSSILEDP